MEVLDHLRPNASTEAALSHVSVDGSNVLDEEEPGLVPDKWLSDQRIAHGHIDHPHAHFIDVMRPELLAALNDAARVQSVLGSPPVKQALGDDARLDEGTIRLGGPVGRAITQAVSREVFEAKQGYVGVSYISRFSDHERCWAVFDDRVHIQFDVPVPLDVTDSGHREAVHDVAGLFNLVLPPSWGA